VVRGVMVMVVVTVMMMVLMTCEWRMTHINTHSTTTPHHRVTGLVLQSNDYGVTG
jgi:hypothetical protein